MSYKFMSMFDGERVLVIGGTGSIGRQIVKMLLEESKPSFVGVVGRTESKHSSLLAFLNRASRDVPYLTSRYVDISNWNEVESLFKQLEPTIVIHAAAMKYVPECEKNVRRTIQTNVVGAGYIIDACDDTKSVKCLTIVSTDKAAKPHGVMGITKFLQERILFDTKHHYRSIVTRFGNVLGSEGSVTHLFKKQLQEDVAVSLTHTEMKRFVMTPKEAGELVLYATSSSPDRSITIKRMLNALVVDIFLEMAKKIAPERKTQYSVIGLRPGEKLSETLFNANEEQYLYLEQTEIGHVGVVDINGYISRKQRMNISEFMEVYPVSGQLRDMLEASGVYQ